MFTPLDILYIVLAFCALWFTAAMFWFFYQLATVLKNVNDTISDARDKMNKIEQVLNMICEKFEKASSFVGIGANTAAKAVEYAMEKKREYDEKKASRPPVEPVIRRPGAKKPTTKR